MNCQSCNTRIDYRFLTNCAHCGREVVPATVTETVTVSSLPPSVQKTFTSGRVINLGYLFSSSIAGMISGAVVVYLAAAILFTSVFRGGDPSANCRLGMAFGFWSLVSGAFLGTVGGSVFAIKHPLCKNREPGAFRISPRRMPRQKN